MGKYLEIATSPRILNRAWLESLPVEHRSAGLERGLPQGNLLTRKHWPFVRFAAVGTFRPQPA
jgi:hypothetical protein